MNFAINVVLDDTDVPVTGDSVNELTLSQLANLFPCRIILRLGDADVEEKGPLLVFYGEFLQSFTQCMFTGSVANLYMNSTPVAWIEWGAGGFLIKYMSNPEIRHSVLVSPEVVRGELIKLGDYVKDVLDRHPLRSAITETLARNRSFETDMISYIIST